MIKAKMRFGPFEAARPGVTLVELLVVVLVAFIVVCTALTLYRAKVTYHLRESARLAREQNLRAALTFVARDIRMAGNGFAIVAPGQQIQLYVPKNDLAGREDDGWFRYADDMKWGARPIFGVDGEGDGEGESDTLTIFRSEIEITTPLGFLASPYTYTDGEYLHLKTAIPEGTLRYGDILALVSDNLTALAEVGSGNEDQLGKDVPPLSSVPINLGGHFTPPLGSLTPVPPGYTEIPQGSKVYNLRVVTFVTYYLDNHLLMADYHDQGGPVEVASNIDDFQVCYYFDDDPTLDHCEHDLDVGDSGRQVKSVALGLMARSPLSNSREAAPRPKLFNRDDPGPPDKYPRSSQTEIIHLRNF